MRRILAVALVTSVALSGAPVPALATASPLPSVSVQQEPGKIVGVLKDANGKPLQNATVNILDKTGTVVGQAVTDANGLFSVTLPAGSYTVSAVSSTGAALAGSTAVTVTAGATTTIAATATAAGAIAVTAGSAGFIAALGGPIVATALIAGGVVGAVAIQQALDDASPSR